MVIFPEPAMEYAEGCDHRDEQEEKRSEAALEAVAAAPQPSCPASARVVLRRPAKPHEIEDSQAVKHGRDQNPHAIAIVEGCKVRRPMPRPAADGRRRCTRL